MSSLWGKRAARAALAAMAAAVLAAAGCDCGGNAGGETDATAPGSDAGAAEPAATDAAPPPDPIRPVEGDIFPEGPGPGTKGGPYPIVLCHGMGGFDALGPLEYFFGVADHLADLGHDVWVTEVPMFDSVAARAALLAPQIDDILAASGAARVNLIGHSQGGLDIRYLVSSLGYGSVVASLTTIASPHGGTPVADLAEGLIPGPSADILSALVVLFAPVLGATPEADLSASMSNLTTEYVTTVFNPANPDDPAVAYFSVAGVCEGIPYLIGVEDLCDVEVMPTHLFLNDYGPNDGLLTEASATWGTYLGAVPADHLDEVGQIAGITSLAFDHLDFYADLAGFLVDQGF